VASGNGVRSGEKKQKKPGERYREIGQSNKYCEVLEDFESP
jgi:hypothetical protein